VTSLKSANIVSDPSNAKRTRRGTIVTRLAGRPPILMYHGVGGVSEDPFRLFVSSKRFAEQMRALRLLGLRGVSLGQLGDAVRRREADGLAGLTFDDGYRDVLSSAAPILERHEFTATVFAVSGLLRGENVWDPPPRRQLMSEADLRDLIARGWEIGSHTLTHPRLTELDGDGLRHEVSASRTALSDVLGVEPRCFCYPYGSVDAETVRAVQDAGYSYACAVRRVPGLPTLLAIPRIGVTQQDWGPRFIAKLFLRGR
jgi:peptidoglycan/xylan/chitin deacetylase (PgdA/CDA1 family)